MFSVLSNFKNKDSYIDIAKIWDSISQDSPEKQNQQGKYVHIQGIYYLTWSQGREAPQQATCKLEKQPKD